MQIKRPAKLALPEGLLDRILEMGFRIGFSTVFLINSVTAIVDPDGFKKLLDGNFAAQMIGNDALLIWFIAINDFLIATFILSGVHKKYVYFYSGMWLVMVTFFKFTSLV